MSALVQVALGGALGALLRYLCAAGIMRIAGAGFPWGTLAVNVAGSFAMGIAAVLLALRGDLARCAPFVMPGLLGGFTTFSAFSLEIVQLAERGRPAAAAFYAGGSVALGLIALGAGMWLARAGLAG